MALLHHRNYCSISEFILPPFLVATKRKGQVLSFVEAKMIEGLELGRDKGVNLLFSFLRFKLLKV